MRWRLWLAAIVLFGVGDVVTTYLGLSVFGVADGRYIVEAAPVSQEILGFGGYSGMVVWKAAVIAAFFLAYLFAGERVLGLPRESRVGIPLGLAMFGLVVVAWNLNVIF